MNIYEQLKQLNHDYHVLVEQVLKVDAVTLSVSSNMEMGVNVKNEFAARAADVINSMNRANSILKPYFEV